MRSATPWKSSTGGWTIRSEPMGRNAIIGIAFIILAALVIAFIWTADPTLVNSLLGINSNIYVSGVSLEINNAYPMQCFGNVIRPLPGFYVQRGSEFNLTFNLTNTCADGHNITSVGVMNGGFSTSITGPKLAIRGVQEQTRYL